MTLFPHQLELEQKYSRHLKKALDYLEKSYGRAQKLPSKLDLCTDTQLETWESFSSRFARVLDLYLTKYLRIQIQKMDPGFEGTLKDYLNFAEKAGLIHSAEFFLSLREFRNIQAHEYTEDSFETFVKGLLAHTPTLLKLNQLFP